MATRKGLSKRTRFEVFKRDGFSCQYCGEHPPKVVLHVDHIVAVAEGGANDMDNLVTACQPCNAGKSDKSLTDVPQSLKDKAAAIAEREEQLRGYHAVMEGKRDRLEDESWRVAEILKPGCENDGFRIDWRLSVRRFIEKLGLHEVLEAAEIASSRKGEGGTRFRYFCGICWRKVTESGQ